MGTFRRIFKPVKHIDWSYAVGEIVLIFVGISLAIWFNNWNEERNERETEVQLLFEIQANLDETIRHFESVNKEELKRAKAYKNLALHIQEGHANPDSDPNMGLNLYYLCTYTGYFPRKAGFESLRNWGVYRVSNDSIRAKLTALHEKEYASIEDMVAVDRGVYMEVYNSEILKYVDFSRGTDVSIRNNTALIADEDFANKLFAMATDNEQNVKFVQYKLEIMKEIYHNLTDEIDRLK